MLARYRKGCLQRIARKMAWNDGNFDGCNEGRTASHRSTRETLDPSKIIRKQVRSCRTSLLACGGLLVYERAGRKSAAITKGRKRAEKYLLERGMFCSLRSGEVIDERWLRFSFPTFWHYDVLRGLDYLRSAGIKPDSRVREAIETVIKRRNQNGRWPLNLLHAERIPLEMETAVGSASRWNTLRAFRVLRWYNNST